MTTEVSPIDLTEAAPPPLPADRFLNRELSWLDFNARVLAMAEDLGTPLLERVKFLAIFTSNLDEFFMVRVAGLQRRHHTGLAVRSRDGLSSRDQLARIAATTAKLATRQSAIFSDTVLPALEAEGIRIRKWQDLPEKAKAWLQTYFREQVFPVLTPLAVDPAHPFPYISGLSLNLAVVVRDPTTGARHFARVKMPNNVPRFVKVAVHDGEETFVPLEELVAAHLDQLFPGLEVHDQHAFRVTRNADVEVEEDRDEDLLKALERELARRRFGRAVRLEVHTSIADDVLDLLRRELDISDSDVVKVPGLLDQTSLWSVYALDRPDLKDAPLVPSTHPRLVEGESPADMFAALREGDVLVHHPYQSFSTSVQRFVEQAAADPDVLAIKQTLYRTSGDSPVFDALIDAAHAGKQVVVVVEIKARFDEQSNITWARALERAGCHVVYGLVGLKTHCKLALVIRREKGQLRRYAHVGTGNYNPKTARIYEDLGLFTADQAIGADLTDLFNTLTGYSRQTSYRSLLVAPQGLRSGIIAKIDREVANAREGRPAGVRMKMNSLVDEAIIDALYRASQAGVPVDLVIRGICSLRPGVPGLSENIRVRSIIGRFLEHSRVFSFAGGGKAEVYIGSSDLMHRNLDRRVETLVRVGSAGPRKQILDLLDLCMSESVVSWWLGSDGVWTRHTHGEDGRALRDPQNDVANRVAAYGLDD